MRQKKCMAVVLVIAILSIGFSGDGFIRGFNGYKATNQNLEYINFTGFDLELTRRLNDKKNFSIPGKSWRDREIFLWENAIQRAVLMLPDNFFKKIKKIDWIFLIDHTSSDTAQHQCGFVKVNHGLVKVNLFPDIKKFQRRFSSEPFLKDGLVESERIFVALHEIAHEYSCGNETDVYNIGKEQATTKYGRALGPHEDFADTLALYVMWPASLGGFPIHYQIMQKILAREYISIYTIPNSIKTRLISITTAPESHNHKAVELH